jgi:hypothetical protein
MGVSAFPLEEPGSNGHFDRAYMLDAAETLLSDLSAVTDAVPGAIIAFGEDEVTVYGASDGMPWREFARTALDVCQTRDDVYGLALVRPHGEGAFICTSHFEDGQSTIDHGFVLPAAQYYRHVPQAEPN